MSELRRCRGTWAYCDGDCSRCTTTATTQTSMVYLIQPTANVVEVRRGKWERHYSRPNVFADLYWHCSACGYKNDNQWANVYHLYCPNCGAKMDVVNVGCADGG